MYFNSMFNLDKWDDSADYAIFDDWEDWSKFYFYKQFLGAQQEFELSDKYKKKQTVRWGKPTILLSNTYPNFSDDQWIEGNCFIYFLNQNEKFYE